MIDSSANENIESEHIKEQLRLAQRRFGSLLKSLPTSIAIVNSAGSIEAVNASFVTLFGYHERELVGQNIELIMHHPPWDKTSNIQDWSVKNGSHVVELQGLTKSQEIVPIDFGINPLDADVRDRLLVHIHDVTERYLANELKHKFYQMINHDVRSPLTNVVFFLDMLERRPECGTLTDFGKERLAGAQINIKRILRLINGLLDLDKLQTSRKANAESVDVNQLIKESVASVFEAASLKGVAIETSVEDITIVGDFGMLQQLVVNLLSNAIGHSPEGKPLTVNARVHSSKLRVEIRDHGVGVPDKDKAIIFERFKQGANRKPGGYGLGLAICREIVMQHSGTIGCSDAAGGGSVFWFEIPAVASI